MKQAAPLSSSAFLQEFERLREELPAGAIAVTGARGGEGVSSVALGLARVLARRRPTLLAEGELARPALAQQLGVQGPGLLDWDRSAPLPVHAVPQHSGLWLLAAGAGAGPVPTVPGAGPVPAAVDQAALLAAAAAQARSQFAQVVWDAPPLSFHPDLLSLAPHLDGALVVIEMDGSRVDELAFLRDVLARAGIPILGSVLNRAGRYWPRPRRRAAPQAPA